MQETHAPDRAVPTSSAHALAGVVCRLPSWADTARRRVCSATRRTGCVPGRRYPGSIDDDAAWKARHAGTPVNRPGGIPDSRLGSVRDFVSPPAGIAGVATGHRHLFLSRSTRRINSSSRCFATIAATSVRCNFSIAHRRSSDSCPSCPVSPAGIAPGSACAGSGDFSSSPAVPRSRLLGSGLSPK